MRSRVLGRASAQVSLELEEAARLAVDSRWQSGAQHLVDVRRSLVAQDVRLAVVGEFKQGKSTLANAILRTDLCPVDQDVVTTVPTVVRWGATARASAVVDGEAHEVPVEAVAQWMRPEGRPGELNALEIELDRPLLRAGLTLIDTPGVGGLDSAHGQLTKATISTADATLFVTDASAELTAPELDFLADAAERCRNIVVVITKTDLYGEWERMRDLDAGHLERAGFELPVICVSSFLRMRAAARDDTVMNERSGYPRLLDHLAGSVVGDADRLAAARATQELLFVTRQLAEHMAAERAVLADAGVAPTVERDLAASSRRGRQLCDDSASWMTALQDGLADLAADLEHDLRERLRKLHAEGDEALNATDPARGWPEFEAWARKAAAAVAVGHLQLHVQRSENLASEVAARFDLGQRELQIDLPASVTSVRAIDALVVDFQKSRVRQALGAMTAARVTYYGVVVTAAVVSSVGAALLAPAIGLAVGAGAIFTRTLVKDEGSRQLDARRAQARAVFRAYVDEVTFVLGKESRDAVRRTQRHLRDEFGHRARLVSQGSEQALAAVRQAARVQDPSPRLQAIDHGLHQLEAIAVTAGDRR